jgi:Protein of unknown function (DUF1641)
VTPHPAGTTNRSLITQEPLRFCLRFGRDAKGSGPVDQVFIRVPKHVEESPMTASMSPVGEVSTPDFAAADQVLAALERIERRLAEVERTAAAMAPVAGIAETLPGAIAMLSDTFDGVATRLADAGIDLDDRMRSVLRAIEVATAPRAVEGLASLVESRLLDPSTLAVINQLAAALAAPGAAPAVGLWGAIRALREPEVQRAFGFLLAVARQFGKHLASGDLESHRSILLSATSRSLEAQ